MSTAATVGAYADHTFEGVPTQGQRPCKNDATTYLFAYAVTLPAAFGNLERNFCLRDHSPINIVLSGIPCGALQGHQPAGSKPHPAPCSSTSTQTPKCPIDILQPHQHPGPKVFQRAEGRFWAFNASNMDSFARGLVVSLCTRAYTVPTQSLRESLRLFQGSPGRNLVKHSAQARALWPLQQQAGGKRRTSRLQLAWTASGLSCSVALV